MEEGMHTGAFAVPPSLSARQQDTVEERYPGMCPCWARCTKGLSKSQSSSCIKSHWQGSGHIPAALTFPVQSPLWSTTCPHSLNLLCRLKPTFQWARSSYPHFHLNPGCEKAGPSPRAFRAHEGTSSRSARPTLEEPCPPGVLEDITPCPLHILTSQGHPMGHQGKMAACFRLPQVSLFF